MTLTAIAPPGYDVTIDLRYATPANFTGKPVYARAEAFLHADAARHLGRAIEQAAALGLRLKIFDAFRPSEAQWKLWDFNPDPDFIADPRRGSPHSRGVAVDLTLIDGITGAEIDMGTEFDAFTPLSYHGCIEVSREAQRNRHMLLGLMSAAGWDFYMREWWHYQLFESKRYPVLSDSVLSAGLMGAA
jgi:D-alanyl-D-alanine dipeptidase